MGIIHHYAIILTADSERIEMFRQKAKEIFDSMVSAVVFSRFNGYASIFIAPDGSKEGWNESDNGDKQRNEFIKWLREAPGYPSWVEVGYGELGYSTLRNDKEEVG